MDILVVDDDAAALESLATALNAFGHQVTCAEDGHDAVRAVVGRGAHGFDALVLAWSLPDLSGAEVHLRLCEIDRRLADRTLFVSDHPGLWPMRQSGRLLGRPLDPARLDDRLEALVDGRLPAPRRAMSFIGATMPRVPVGPTSG